MNENIFDITSTDGTVLSCAQWDKDDSPKAILAIVHGHGEHKMRYKHVAELFVEEDYVVFALDNRGHGESEGKRGHSPSHDQLLDDVEQFMMAVRNQYTDLPLFLYGHSMGGNIVSNYVMKRKTKELSGIILTSPMFKLAFEPPKWKLTLGNMMTNIWPSLTQPTGLETKHISTDPKEVDKYQNDPLIHDKMSAALFSGLMEAGDWVLNHADELTHPAFVMHGTSDQIISPEGSKILADKSGDNITLKLWDGLYHELQNEKNKEEIIGTMIQWTDKLI